MIERHDVLGVGVSVVNMMTALATIDGWITRNDRQYVCFTDVNGIMESYRNPAVRDCYNRAGLATPDGMPLVWLLGRAGHREVDRVYGPDLMPALIEYGLGRGYRHFFYGTTAQTLCRLSESLLKRYPAVQIVGSYAPPFRALSAHEQQQVNERINASKANVVWIGLGAPKQEVWMAANRAALTAPVLLGVGAAFDIHAGNIKQPPRFVQRSGFEWLYRLVKEPRRLYKRYLRNNPAFVMLICFQKVRAGL